MLIVVSSAAISALSLVEFESRDLQYRQLFPSPDNMLSDMNMLDNAQHCFSNVMV